MKKVKKFRDGVLQYKDSNYLCTFAYDILKTFFVGAGLVWIIYLLAVKL